MEFTKKQIELIKEKLGETEFNNIVNYSEFKGDLIYAFRGMHEVYKLHRIEGDNYAWISLSNSNNWANGVGKVNEMLKHPHKKFDSIVTFSKWLNTL